MSPSRKGIIAALVLSAVIALGVGVAAQTIPASARDTMTPAERELFDAYMEDRLITARRLADEVLVAEPDSMVGHYVLGSVLRRSEGDLPDAARHLGRARELYETTWSVAPAPPGAPWQMHREILYSIIELAQELEQPGYRLEMIDYYDAIYTPDLHAVRAWTLMDLGRFEEARAAAAQAIAADDEQERSLGYNTRCAIETEAGTRLARLEACAAALDWAQQRAARTDATDPINGVNVAVHAYNAGLAALAALQPAEAESLAREGTTRLAYTPANPWRLLTRLYLAQGRSNDAATALTEMDRWRRRQPPYLRDQARAETEAVYAQVMLVAGRTEQALTAITRSIDRPDRRGLTSSQAGQAVGAYAVTRLAAQRAHEERQAEIAAAWGLSGNAPPLVALRNQTQRLADMERVRASLSTERLVETIRPYSPRGLDIPVWMTGELVGILGAGVVDVAIIRARRDEELGEQAAPWLDAMEFEVEVHRRNLEQARVLAERVLQGLPAGEVLLRARTAALLGRLELDRGEASQGVALLATAMELDPGVVRRLGIALPARMEVQGDGHARTVAERLENSPRFQAPGVGFGVNVSAEAGRIQICLFPPTGGNGTCSVTTQAPEEMDDDFLVRAVDDFHVQAFAMPLQLDTVSLSTLDGRTSASSAAAREQLENVLDAAMEGRQPTPPPVLPDEQPADSGAATPAIPVKPPRPGGW